MNTLTILDANTSIIHEGLYLELANALKKDFDDKEYNVLELHFKLEGFADGFPECLFDCNSALRYLKKQCDNMDIVKEIFEVANDIIKEMKLADTNYKIITNGGDFQSSQHLHFHLVSGEVKKSFNE